MAWCASLWFGHKLMLPKLGSRLWRFTSNLAGDYQYLTIFLIMWPIPRIEMLVLSVLIGWYKNFLPIRMRSIKIQIWPNFLSWNSKNLYKNYCIIICDEKYKKRTNFFNRFPEEEGSGDDDDEEEAPVAPPPRKNNNNKNVNNNQNNKNREKNRDKGRDRVKETDRPTKNNNKETFGGRVTSTTPSVSREPVGRHFLSQTTYARLVGWRQSPEASSCEISRHVCTKMTKLFQLIIKSTTV